MSKVELGVGLGFGPEKRQYWDPTWEFSFGEETIEKRKQSKNTSLILYSSWFCPFAQRAWIAMEEKKVDYLFCDVNPYEVDPSEPGGYTKTALSLNMKRHFYPDFVETSPKGLIPGLHNGDDRVSDSLDVVRYIDEHISTESGSVGGPSSSSYLPESEDERARQQQWSEFVTSRMQKAFYQVLIGNSAIESKEKDKLLNDFFQAVAEFADECADISKGPFFLGDHFTMVDIALAPFWQRFIWIGLEYIGLDVEQEAKDGRPGFRRMSEWWKAVSERDSVKCTLVCRPRLVSSYSRYSQNKATSNYGKMIQRSLGLAGGSDSEGGYFSMTQVVLVGIAAFGLGYSVRKYLEQKD